MKYLLFGGRLPLATSRPARGGWIEIDKTWWIVRPMAVPPRTGRVD